MAVILLVMLTGISPFADPEAPHDQIRLFNVSTAGGPILGGGELACVTFVRCCFSKEHV